MYGQYGTYSYGWDATYTLVLIAAAVSLLASFHVRSVTARYAKTLSSAGLTGAVVAERILRANGIYDVSITQIAGSLTDHYNSKEKTLSLSQTVYGSSSVTAVAVAAHECGHALQDDTDYAPLRVRGALVPVATFGSYLGLPMVILGLMFSAGSFLVTAGICVFSLAVLFQVVTLPVEFDASRRALKCLEEYRIVSEEELKASRKVLTAAALTYVASAASAVLQLLRLLALANRRRD